MPSSSGDDDIIRGGPLMYWFKYKVWGVPGYVLVLITLIVGAIIGHKL